jgi:hypothetical protein
LKFILERHAVMDPFTNYSSPEDYFADQVRPCSRTLVEEQMVPFFMRTRQLPKSCIRCFKPVFSIASNNWKPQGGRAGGWWARPYPGESPMAVLEIVSAVYSLELNALI